MAWSRRNNSAASAVTATRAMVILEETEFLGAIAHQHVLGLLVVIEHHPVVLPTDPRLLVAAKRRMRRIRVIAVHPYAPRLDPAAHAIRRVMVPRPDARAQSVQRVVGD